MVEVDEHASTKAIVFGTKRNAKADRGSANALTRVAALGKVFQDAKSLRCGIVCSRTS